jgi:hypothetical protein
VKERAFICQISEEDWEVSRSIGVYGNREGSERKGEPKYFEPSSQTVQSIIEDLVGMRKGDLVFFHVIKEKEESSIHGVYRVREEPFYNTQKVGWRSKHFLYPYRFCFEPHPDYEALCKYDANIPVSQLYATIEVGTIRSILTLEREERGQAHAVKTITREDAKELIKLLCREFSKKRSKRPITFNPLQMSGTPLKDHIKGVGRLEFAVKAVMAHKLGRSDHNLIQLIPACKTMNYDFLIQSYIGQTMRKPADFICIGYEDSRKTVSIIEVKRDKAKPNDLIQLLKYQELFRLRNVGKDEISYEFSPCLVAQTFQEELIDYCYLRNLFIPWERVILIKYRPTSNGTDALFEAQTLSRLARLTSKAYALAGKKIEISKVLSDPRGFYFTLKEGLTNKISVEISSHERDTILLRKYYQVDGSTLGYVLIYISPHKCGVKEFIEFMKRLYEEVRKTKEKFMAIEPILISKDYDDLVISFIELYNYYEIQALRQPIMTLTLIS